MASVSPIKMTQPRERRCPGSGVDKDLRRGTEQGLVRWPKSFTRTDYKALPAAPGALRGRCRQCQGGSAFPDAGFCSRPPAESGAGREETRCSRPPLYSGSIGRGAAYARCQSPASRSGGTGPGAADALSAIGTEEAMNAAGIAVRSGGAPGGLADGPMALQRPEDGRARGAREAGPEEERRPGRWRLREERAARSEAAPCRGPRGPAAQGRTAGRAGRLCRLPAVTPQLTREGPPLPSTPLSRRGGGSGPGPTPAPERRAPRPRVLCK